MAIFGRRLAVFVGYSKNFLNYWHSWQIFAYTA
jgi:hypothetical protein